MCNCAALAKMCTCEKKDEKEVRPAHLGHPAFCACPECSRGLFKYPGDCPSSADM